ncbi:MAG: hypothetical protein SOS24_03630 [Clostridia bacterium]|nr:hypothetical protein [Clostridia bacterium]
MEDEKNEKIYSSDYEHKSVDNTAQTSTDVSNPTPDGYVKALGGIAAGNKAQVQMESMNEITKFTF